VDLPRRRHLCSRVRTTVTLYSPSGLLILSTTGVLARAFPVVVCDRANDRALRFRRMKRSGRRMAVSFSYHIGASAIAPVTFEIGSGHHTSFGSCVGK